MLQKAWYFILWYKLSKASPFAGDYLDSYAWLWLRFVWTCQKFAFWLLEAMLSSIRLSPCFKGPSWFNRSQRTQIWYAESKCHLSWKDLSCRNQTRKANCVAKIPRPKHSSTQQANEKSYQRRSSLVYQSKKRKRRPRKAGIVTTEHMILSATGLKESHLEANK